MLQFVYYNVYMNNRQVTSSQVGAIVLPCVFALSGVSIFSSSYLTLSAKGPYDTEFRGRQLMGHGFNSATEELGYVFGCVSAVCYLSGRIPQLIKNHRRQSTEGISLAMFVIIIFGNLTYGLSVILGGQG